MKFNLATNELLTQSGKLIKRMECPLNKDWDDLLPLREPCAYLKRRCSACNRTVLNITFETEEAILAVVEYDPEVCLYINTDDRDVELIASDKPLRNPRSFCVNNQTEDGEHIIRTARTIDEMKYAEENGLKLLVKRIHPSPEIYSNLGVKFNKDSGRHIFSGDLRGLPITLGDQEPTESYPIRLFRYYPYNFPAPIAAYIIPDNLEAGERVFLVDLIEDFIGSKWNQGPSSRLSSCSAVWNGSDFDVEWDNSMAGEILG